MVGILSVGTSRSLMIEIDQKRLKLVSIQSVETIRSLLFVKLIRKCGSWLVSCQWVLIDH